MGVDRIMVRSLDQLKPREQGVVASLKGMGAIQQRLCEMGVIDGTHVEVLRHAPFGGPMELFVRGFHLTLRKSEASLILVES